MLLVAMDRFKDQFIREVFRCSSMYQCFWPRSVIIGELGYFVFLCSHSFIDEYWDFFAGCLMF